MKYLGWEFAGFDAPGLREILFEQLPTPQPSPTPLVVSDLPEKLTYSDIISGILITRCGACHGESAQGGLNLSAYAGVIAGGENGSVIIPGDPEASLLLQKTTGEEPHFSQFSNQELELIRQWIDSGAPEN